MDDPCAKCSSAEENDKIKYVVSWMKGPRDVMEDAHTTVLELHGSESTSFFGVFDGHGGDKVAWYCARQFHIELINDPAYRSDPRTAMENTFFRVDETLKRSDKWKKGHPCAKGNFLDSCKASLRAVIPLRKKYKGPQREGCTACVVLIRGNQLFVGNAGDSRCVLSRNGQAIDLSTDHKPNVLSEKARVEEAGGQVLQNVVRKKDGESGRFLGTELGVHRIDGIIAISRAIGDFQFKENKKLTPAQQRLTCNPDIRTENITADTNFLLIATGSVWNVKSSQDVVTYVNKHLRSGTDTSVICERLLESCTMSEDNSTVILVVFKPNAWICSELTNASA